MRSTNRVHDLSGAVVGRLTIVLREGESDQWRVRCLCGGQEVVSGDHLRSGFRTGCRRCGPLVGDWHGTPIWERWERYRISRQLVQAWEMSFAAFLRTVGPPPYAGAMLTRPDPTRKLGPENWRWTRPEELLGGNGAQWVHEGRVVATRELAIACGVAENTINAYARKHPDADGDAIALHFAEQRAAREAQEAVRRIIRGRSPSPSRRRTSA